MSPVDEELSSPRRQPPDTTGFATDRRAPSPPWPGPITGLVLLLSAALLLHLPYRNFTTDDAFIHYQFASNLGEGRGFSYNAGQPTYGDTSPLWVVLLTLVGGQLDSGAAAPRGRADSLWLASKLLDALSLAAGLILFATIARRRIRTPRWGAAAVTALWLLDPWLIKWGMAGMEAPLAAAVALLALYCRDRCRNSGAVDPWTPLILGVGYLVRPEMCLLAAVLVVDVMISETRRRRADLWLACTVPLVPALPWLVYAQASFGGWLPDTLAARRDVNYSFIYVVTKLGKILGATYALPIAAVAVVLVRRGGARRRLAGAPEHPVGGRPSRDWVFPLLSAALVCGFYLSWRVSVGARYLLVFTPFLVLVGYGALLHGLARRPRLRVAALALAAMVLVGIQIGAVRFVTAWPQGLDDRLFEIARWLRVETPPDAVVAAHEIGVIGYVSERRIVDLGSLVSPDVEPVSRTGSVARSLGDRHVDYLVWNSNEEPDAWLLEDMRGRVEPLLVRRVRREGSSHFGGWQYYTVYRVR